MNPPSIDQRLANLFLQTTARSVSTSVTDYQKWLVAGIGAAIGLLLPKLHQLSQLVGETHTAVILGLLCVVLVLAVFALLLGAQVVAATTVGPELEKALETMTPAPGEQPDLAVVFSEMRRGLWWPASWGFSYGRQAAERGDHVAAGRLVARLSQAQVYLVIAQLFLVLAAVVVAATAAL